MTLALTIHRAADEIGGNYIELALDDHRLQLDVLDERAMSERKTSSCETTELLTPNMAHREA